MADAPTVAAAGPLLFGRYRVLEQLGEGRLAVVYSALDERLQRKVLLHLLRKDLVGQEPLRQRFIAEVNASARRSHPALLEVFDSGESGGRPFMITEYVAGRPLRQLGALTLEQALLYTRQVASAVAVCQQLNLPHPQISSSNVLLVDEGRVKLVESWLLPPGDVLLDLAHYRPPERTAGQAPGPANAVYALGLLLYELITGARPVTGDDARSVAVAHLTVRVPRLSEVRPTCYLPSLEQLLARATARRPEDRPADAAAFSDGLDELWRTLGTQTRRLGSVPALPRRRRGDTAVSWRPPPTPDPATPPAADAAAADERGNQPLDRQQRRRQSLLRGVAGWLVVLVLIMGMAFGSYVLTSYMLNQLFAIQLPQIRLPDLGIRLPVPAGGSTEHVLVVNIEQGLNLRDRPGVSTTIQTVVPNGTRVYQIEGPVSVDNVPWVRVRVELDGQAVEGWMSLNYLKPEG